MCDLVLKMKLIQRTSLVSVRSRPVASVVGFIRQDRLVFLSSTCAFRLRLMRRGRKE